MRTKVLLAGLGVAVAARVIAAGAASPAVDRAFQEFFAAADTTAASDRTGAIVRARATMADAQAALKAGRTYSADVPRGVTRASHRVGATEFAYTLDVPPTYDPAKRY